MNTSAQIFNINKDIKLNLLSSYQVFFSLVLTASGGIIPTENFSSWKSTYQSAQTFQALPAISLSRFGSSHNENGASLSSLAYNSAVEAKTTAHNQDSVGSQAAYDVKRNLANVAAGVRKNFNY